MRQRDLIRQRAQILMRAHGFKNTRYLKGRPRIAYFYLLHALRKLTAYGEIVKGKP